MSDIFEILNSGGLDKILFTPYMFAFVECFSKTVQQKS